MFNKCDGFCFYDDEENDQTETISGECCIYKLL